MYRVLPQLSTIGSFTTTKKELLNEVLYGPIPYGYQKNDRSNLNHSNLQGDNLKVGQANMYVTHK